MPDLSKNEPPQKRRHLLSEPLIHFAIIALFLFLSFALIKSSDFPQIEVSQREIDARIYIAELSAGRALQPAEKEEIATSYIQQQVLVHEAKLRSLDNDSRIHDILDQKLRHVLSGDLIQPSAADLEQFFENNQTNYLSVATVSLDEIIFDRQTQLNPNTVDALAAGLSSSEIMMLQASTAAPLPGVSKDDVSSIFNQAIANQVFESSSKGWIGPYLSNRGQHWLQVLERQPAEIPEFGEITDLLRLDWMALEEDLLLEKRISEILDEYTVVVVNDTQ